MRDVKIASENMPNHTLHIATGVVLRSFECSFATALQYDVASPVPFDFRLPDLSGFRRGVEFRVTLTSDFLPLNWLI